MASIQSRPVFDEVAEDYLAPILAEIRANAEKKAQGGELKAIHAFRAFEEHFAGLPKPPRTSGFLQDNIFLLSAIFLTIVFGAFGLYHPDDQDVASFLDIAKIFAGAVVGGAAGSSVATLARRRSGGTRG